MELQNELQKVYGWIIENNSSKGVMVSADFKDVTVKPFRLKNKDIVAESPCGFYWISKDNNWLKKGECNEQSKTQSE